MSRLEGSEPAVSQRGDELQRLGLVGLGLIHEMSTPVLAAQLSLQALVMELEAGTTIERSTLIERLQKDITRHQALAKKIHRFRRWLKTDQPELDCVSAVNTLRSVVEMLTPGLAIAGLAVPTLTSDATLSDARIEADEIWLEHALTGLVLNASQATESLGHEALVQLGLEETKEHVVLTIQDNGDGFTAGTLPAGKSTGPLGLGVGLMLAHRLITSMGGEIKFEKRSPSGTTVRIRLNRAD